MESNITQEIHGSVLDININTFILIYLSASSIFRNPYSPVKSCSRRAFMQGSCMLMWIRRKPRMTSTVGLHIHSFTVRYSSFRAWQKTNKQLK